MAFKMILDNLDGLPEDVAKEYLEQDGKFVIQVEGMKTQEDINKVQTSLTAARTEAKGYKDKLALLGDRKIEEIIPMLDRIPELELAAKGKLDDAAIDTIVETRIKGKLAPVERERDTLKTKVGELEGTVSQFTEKDKVRKIHKQVREAAKAAGVIDEAVEDALLLADRTFELSDDGVAVVKDGVAAAAGLAPKDWLVDMQAKRPHWFGESSGGGAGGNRQGLNGGGKNPFTAEHWNMTEQGKLLNENRSRAETLAKAAGTTIGGPKPAPKK